MHNFSKMILHSLLLIIFVVLLLIFSMSPYFYGEKYYYQDAKVRESLSGELDTLIIGSSHALRSVKPTVMNEELGTKAYNLSSPLMSMYGRYVLLKKEVERNPIKTVYIELSYNAMALDRENLGLEGDLYLLGRLDNMSERLEFASNAFEKDDYETVFMDTIQRSTYAISNVFYNGGLEQYKTFGYLPVPSVDHTLTEERKKEILNTETLDSKFKTDNVDKLVDFIELCKENDIRVVLIVTPINDRMILQHTNMDDVFNQYIELAKEYDCEYYDFNLDKERFKLYDEVTSYYDITHLSNSGANIFTTRLSEIINSVDEGKDVSKEFYDSYEQLKKAILKK